mmetsp:Transcript_30272/g.77408  ORF Transcript_30272/g.77408 Transcript_30272/m.77408 type:complete len:322 (-) Transcript_30272:306-1271(-)
MGQALSALLTGNDFATKLAVLCVERGFLKLGDHALDDQPPKATVHGELKTLARDADVRVTQRRRPEASKEPPAIFEAEKDELQGRQQAFRTKYLGKLSYSGAWAPRAQRPPHHHTVTIFDWDDTILCTTYLHAYSHLNIIPHLCATAALASKLLGMALKVGQVFIVTNAVEGWVQHSAAAFLPELVPILKKVPIISARSRFEPHFPHSTAEWKVQALLEVQQQLNEDAIANVISVGDSVFEIEAARIMGQQFAGAAVKTVKLWERPSPEDLRKQLKLVIRDFEQIVAHPGDAAILFQHRSRDTACGAPPPDPLPIWSRRKI